MRIGFDMLAVQSPHHGHRGIGRYSRHLVAALLENGDSHQFVLYAHDGLPDDRIPRAPNAIVRWLGPESEHDGALVTHRLDRLTRTNPDDLDVLVVLSPFEFWQYYHPPSRMPDAPRIVAVVYDLIPLLFQSETIYNIDLLRSYRTLQELRRYDALLAISESTRADCLAMLGLPEHRVVTIGAASDPDFFCPESPEARSQPEPVLLELGISRPFVLNVGGSDWRKNHDGMIDAFARLPENLRERLQLVLTFSIFPDLADALRRRATEAGIGDALVLTGEVSDHALRALYRRCVAFVFPSLYEGFGLPLLEAMLCGAAVVTGNNSSQSEVVGDAGLLANAADPADLAVKLATILRDPALAQTLRTRALDQAGRFRWERVAAQAAEVLERLSPGPSGQSLVVSAVRTASPEVRTADPTRDPEARTARTGLERRPVARSRGARRPRIAFFSPFPPRKSGISDYSASLIRELTKTYTIDLYHATGYLPELGLASDAFECIDGRLFGRFAAARDYHAVVYQMGNSRHHSFLYETMLTYPGVVTLHDFCVAGFHLDHGFRLGDARGYFAKELLESYPEHEDEIRACLRSWRWDWEVIAQDCARWGWCLNRRIFVRAGRVVVHSPWCVAQARADRPEFAERMVVIPMGAEPRRVSAEQRAAIRARFQIPADAVMAACFGFIHPNKMCPEAITAFQGVAQADGSALFVLVGEEHDEGEARRRAEELGLLDRVRFLGRQSRADFADLAAVTDLGVNLRRPPTNGETSAALLNLLASGIPTIVTDVGTFSDFPGDVVRKVRWESEGLDGLRRALLELATDPQAREERALATWEYVRAHHEWPHVAKLYVDVIEHWHEETAAARGRGAAVDRLA